MNAKKVLIIVGIPNFDYSNNKSAVASFLIELKKAFESNGDSVEFPTSYSAQDNIAQEEVNDSGILNKLKNVIRNWNWLYQSLSFKQFFKNQSQLIDSFSSDKQFDLIIEFYTVGSTLGIDLAKLYKAKYSVVFDSPVDEQFLEMYGTKTIHWNKIKNAERKTLEYADKIMAYSPACESFIRNKYKLSAKIGVLPCVINKESIDNSPKGEVFNIGFIGSFLSWHKVDLLVRAFKVFNTSFPKSRLQLIGYGKEWENVKILVEKYNLTEHIEMPGFVSGEDLLDYKKNFSVAVMPGSNWYGSPLKLFEYAQCGIPFIAPKTQTVESIFIQNEHCYYIDSNDDVNSLVKLLEMLHENPNLAREIGENAKKFYSDNFSEDIYLEKILRVF
jgi:glycosyltransferase involved in cell wall biosynthesis